jgi:Uma2 family endonuclease
MSPTKTAPRSVSTPLQSPALPGEERHVMRGATWSFYDRLSDTLGERMPFRVAYDGKDIEIMALGPKHEGVKELLSLFINEVHDGLEIDCWGLGSTTWKRPELGRGIEADLCYCFDPAKLKACEAADARGSNNVADYPNPDLAVEVDLSPSKIDRPAIYRAMQVSELWSFHAGIVSIEHVGVDGNFLTAESSRFLHVRPDDITRWIVKENSANRRQWKTRLREWVRIELRPRVEAASPGT